MRNPSPTYFHVKLLENSHASQSARLAALRALPHPPLAALLRLLRDSATPARLLAATTDAYARERVRRDQAKTSVLEKPTVPPVDWSRLLGRPV